MSSAYEIAPILLIRMAGVSFEHIARLATPQTIQRARDLLGQDSQILERDKAQLAEFGEKRDKLLSQLAKLG